MMETIRSGCVWIPFVVLFSLHSSVTLVNTDGGKFLQ